MNKIISILFIFICCTSTLSALPVDSIFTEYKEGVFVTQYLTEANVSQTTVTDATTRLVNEFHYTTTDLFKWALKDLGLQNEGNELIIIFKNSYHDPKTGITHGVFDIDVPYFKTFNDIKVDAIVTHKVQNGTTKVTANIIYSSLLLKNGLATLYVIPQKNNKMLLYTHVSIKFGWFFNFFITKKRYKTIVEWRVKQFAENMKDEYKRIESEK